MFETVYDVAIVGYGPSGAIAASLLGQAGLKVLVCDKDAGVYEKPRAIALDHEILRVFQSLDIIHDVLPYCEPFTDSCYYGANGQLIRQLTMVDKPYPLGYTPSVVFTQPPVERVIRKHVADLKTVTVLTETKFLSLEQDSQSVTLHLEREDATLFSVRSLYVIGCDGASSTVRKDLGIKLEDLGFHEPWLVVDALVNEQGLAKLPKTSVQYCDPDRPTTFIIGPKHHRRWEISLKADEDPSYYATQEGTWKLLERWIGPEDATLWRQASYVFHALVAEKWQDGRVFLAGDAAHQQPPFLGQGMCQGVRDVVNLSWKLISILSEQVSEPLAQAELLASYGEERKQHVIELTNTIKKIGQVICERDFNKAVVRDQALLDRDGGQVKPVARQDILPALSAGLITDSIAAGTIFPQPSIQRANQSVLMDKALSKGWKIFVSMSIDPDIEIFKRSNFQFEIVSIRQDFQENEQILFHWFKKFDVAAVIVRPDHYIYAASKTEGDLNAHLTQLAKKLGLINAQQISTEHMSAS